MEPKYSILLCNQNLAVYAEKISAWLQMGIKVLWFGSEEEADRLKKGHPAFSGEFLLQAYAVGISAKQVIIDGCDKENFLETLESVCPLFNTAQYRVEHCAPQDHIVVQASAGTGKTKVMVDRILYLMHMVPGLDMSEIYMITFTNDATDQMNKRLQDALLGRYRLTRQQRYLRWLEQQSQMHISTIHSFAYHMLKEFGIGESFTRNLEIRSFKYEKDKLIKELINDRTGENRTVISQLGVPFFTGKYMVKSFWDGFSRLGISHKDLMKMDWGHPIDTASEPFHKIMTNIIEELDDRYFEIKRENEAVGIDDIMRDLQEVLMDENLPVPDISMKYLFIDEFQDSDLSQIGTACKMVELLSPALFVVGDVKQSIYRFRGATDQAFDLLLQDMKEMGIPSPKHFTLVNNYRTAAGIMTRMDDYFRKWGEMGKLQYEKPVIPFNRNEGTMRMVYGEREEELDEQIAEIICEQWNRLISEVESGEKKPNEKTRVAVLTRTNKELEKIEKLLRSKGIPVSVKKDGSFYRSEAVMDFYLSVSSFLFSDEPKYIFNYLLTPFAGDIEPMDFHELELLNGDYERIVCYLDHFLNQTNWKFYHKELRLRPVMAVLREMLKNEHVVDYFIMNFKAKHMRDGCDETHENAYALMAARQYQANLEKLMEILQNNFAGEKVSLYDICNFLKLNIATNRDEGEAKIQALDDYHSVLCMTVHKSKGLEFDTVIIPYTNRIYPTKEQTEILIDPAEKRIGWNFNGAMDVKTFRTKYEKMKNDLYTELKRENIKNISKEECRILYVAMTRAIDTLICIVPDFEDEKSWAYLLMEVGDIDYE